MRVHQVINSFGLNGGGAERLARQHHIDLRAKGVDATLLALEACSVDDMYDAASLDFSSPYDPRVLPALAFHLLRKLAPGDMIHAHLFPASAHVAALRRMNIIKAPCIFTEHSTHNRRRGSSLGRWIDRAVYGAFDSIVAISNGTESSLLTAREYLQGRTEVILNGCLLRFSEPPARRSGIFPTILSVGRLSAPKNIDTALRALAKLGEQAFRYVVLGDGPERDALSRLSANLGLEGKVSFKGHVADIGPYLEAADIFLMPSRWEGFGLAAVEAMNAALPLVAADVSGLREVVGSDGDCAELVPPEDATAISLALCKLLEAAPAERRRIGLNGFERAKRFEKCRMTEAYISTYRRVLKNHVHSAP